MKKTDVQYIAGNDEEAGWPSWKKAFFVAFLAELGFIAFAYYSYRRTCNYCVLELPYFVALGLLDLLFTAGLWFLLYNLHQRRFASTAGINIFTFLVYSSLWIAARYTLETSGLVNPYAKGRTIEIIRQIVYTSWFDIGKYVAKITVFYVVRHYLAFRQAEKKRTVMALINKDLQLNLLKQQLSPHFYFNTLNNLYGLARNDSPKLPGALAQLSNIMQYVLHDCNQPRVQLYQEISFLESYIALEKLRYEKDTLIDLNVEGNMNGHAILPLLLIQFVENGFKHGMKDKSDKSWMKVGMSLQGNRFLFKVDNSNQSSKNGGGIGLASVKHRLDLQYPGKYDIQVSEDTEKFSVRLQLQLA